METQQLALFGDDQVVGTGQLRPWPVGEPETDPEAVPVSPDQLAFDDTAGEAA